MKQVFLSTGILLAIFISVFLQNNKQVAKPITAEEWSVKRAQQDIANNDVKLLINGLPIPCLDYNKLTQKYGFRYEESGCMPSSGDDKMDIFAYNAAVKVYLNKRNGAQWENKFNAEIDSADKYNPCFN